MKFRLVRHYHLTLMNLRKQYTLLVSYLLVKLLSQLLLMQLFNQLQLVYLVMLVIQKHSHQSLHLLLRIFSHRLSKRRLGTNNSGITHKDDKIIYETGDVNSDKMILDGSSSAVSNTTPSIFLYY